MLIRYPIAVQATIFSPFPIKNFSQCHKIQNYDKSPNQIKVGRGQDFSLLGVISI